MTYTPENANAPPANLDLGIESERTQLRSRCSAHLGCFALSSEMQGDESSSGALLEKAVDNALAAMRKRRKGVSDARASITAYLSLGQPIAARDLVVKVAEMNGIDPDLVQATFNTMTDNHEVILVGDTLQLQQVS